MKTKFRNRTALAGLAAFFALSCAMSAAAYAADSDGVSAKLTTDSAAYSAGDAAEITLDVQNDGGLADISTEIFLPEGMTLRSGSLALDRAAVQTGESFSNKVTADIPDSGTDDSSSSADSSSPDSSSAADSSTPASSSQTTSSQAAAPADTNPSTGSGAAYVWLSFALMSGAALIAIGVKKKQGKRMLSLFMCAAMCLSFAAAEIPVSADELSDPLPDGTLELTREVEINGQKQVIKARVASTPLPDDTETITISFVTDGSAVEPVTVVKGETPDLLPQSYMAGKTFKGWYTDPEHTQEFFEDTALENDITLYADFGEVENDIEVEPRTTYYEEDCAADFAFTLVSDTPISSDNLLNAVDIEAISGEMPESFSVSASGNEYTVVPEQDYTEGGLYRVTRSDWVTFRDLEDSVTEYTFRIFKPESMILDMDSGIKYVDSAHFREKKENSEYIVDAAYFVEKDIKAEDILCLGDGTEKVDEKSRFINVLDTAPSGDDYVISFEDSEPEDVFDNVDISFKKDMTNAILADDFDPEAMADELYMSEGADQINMMMAALLADSESVKNELGGESLLANYAADDPALTDFTQGARLKDDSLFDLSQKLKKNLKVEVTIAEAENENFRIPDPNNWCAIRFTFSYSGTVKNKLKINASISITEYLNISLQGYKSFKFKLFKKSQLEFDYAVNIYSQTDIEFKVLVCSTNKKNEKWRDISKEITDMMNSEEENDQNSLVAQMKEMLESQGDYIQLCEIPLFKSKIPLIEPITVFDINLDLNYVIKVNFAAGMSTKFSVLDATQVGIAGNSSTKEFRSYKNDLDGDNRYSFDLSICGYIGVKTGLEGRMTISFFGLQRLGEVGMGMEVGAYLDIYGYAQYHVAKPSSYYNNVYKTAVGGYYMEIGIYVELKVIAESKVFKLKAEGILFEDKFPLFHMGNKELLLSVNEPEAQLILTNSNKKARYTTVPMSSLPAITGTFLDITTGETVRREISWDSLDLSFSNYAFEATWDNRAWKYTSVRFKHSYYNYDPPAVVECNAHVSYNGQYLQFTRGADYGRNTVVNMKVMWADTSRIDSDRVGKLCKVNYYSELDGKRELLGSREVLAGKTAGAFRIEDYVSTYKYKDGKWNSDPEWTMITNDTDFVYSAVTAQTTVAFVYFDPETFNWVAEMQTVNVGEAPVLPDVSGNEHMRFTRWDITKGVNNYGAKIPSGGVGPLTEGCVTNNYILTTGKQTGVPYNKVYDDEFSFKLKPLLNKTYPNDYYKLAFIFTAMYDFDRLNMTVVRRSFWNYEYSMDYGVRYGTRIEYLGDPESPNGKRFVGYTDEKGGEAKYRTYTDLPKMREDGTYYAVYKGEPCKVTLEYFDEDTLEYKTYKVLDLESGDKIPAEELQAVKDKMEAPEGVEYTIYERWFDTISGTSYKHPENLTVMQDITLRLDFLRTVDVTLDGGEGELLTGMPVRKAVSNKDYALTLENWAAKQDDDYNTYELAGWKDSSTGKIYAVGQPCRFDRPVTLTAVYTTTPKTYNVRVHTQYGELKNGKQTDSFTGGFDDYVEFLKIYEGWLPDKVKDVDYTHTCKTSRYQYSIDNLDLEIEYIWTDKINQYTITLDPNGGTAGSYTEYEYDYGSELELAKLFNPKKSDELCDYVIAGWEDQNGEEYAADGKLILKGDTTISPIWKEGTYKEYTLIYELDGKMIKSERKHFGDELTAPDVPAEAEGYAFSGWKWQDSSGKDIEMPKTMPAETLTVYGTTTKCYVTYKVDGEIYNGPTFTKVGERTKVPDKYEREGYDVTEWTTEDAEVVNGSFTMPDHDVTFTATTTPKTYTITIDVEGAKTTATAEYGSTFTLPEQQAREGYTFYWTGDGTDVLITTVEGVSTVQIPARDFTVTGKYTQNVHNVYFIINGQELTEQTMKDIPAGQENLRTNDFSVDIPEGKEFTGWITGNVELNKEGSFTMPDSDVYFYGKFVDRGSVTIEICTKRDMSMFGETGDPDLYMRSWTLYGEPGDEVELPALEREGYELTWQLQEGLENQFTITNGKLKIAADAADTYVSVNAVFKEKQKS